MLKFVFLSNALRKVEVRKAPPSARELIRMGNTFSIAGIICPTISPEYAIIGPIPTICCEIGR
jgi:hypothetical protein